MQGFLVLRMPSLMSDSAVRLGTGMCRTREPSAKLSPRYYAIEKRNKRNGVGFLTWGVYKAYKHFNPSTNTLQDEIIENKRKMSRFSSAL